MTIRIKEWIYEEAKSYDEKFKQENITLYAFDDVTAMQEYSEHEQNESNFRHLEYLVSTAEPMILASEGNVSEDDKVILFQV